MELQGKIAVVTGVSKGIGLSAVEALLEKGAIVAGWGRTAPELQHQNFHFFECDVRYAESVQNAFDQTISRLGVHVAVLVNNAGLGIGGKLEEISMDDWHTMFDTNVNGVFYCTRLILPEMKEQGEGHIINISSIAGTTGIEEMSGYCGSKFAVRGISQALYKEVRNYGIKVTCIYPGSVNTNFFDNFENVTARENMMRPEDIASTIVHALESHPNYHHVDIEVRPLMPKGKIQKQN
ncbi:SDR family NAD(P)-dependent oxidoreductase [Pontibacter sp. BT310]|uniref:SDR family NAD(P)-dependent oxidoreductase n=1 Tax=Pontibacter populi TaxID=890055 RepID=A0ABS6XEW4_9BACT|nr:MULTISPECIES: SDR family NAD(P)-dependent oxidoreductase [Pontibacter]MBJ6119661.1 SDR family NAD(P)-dependent oxidoreductase [Pontibacter sp. BT310]MBR0572090.1 SDR family NAD(P)-dependent oxidoreductase [Microvirga sp. STS03]MBW3366514.1 SDR family NAD(P)-dependent oxidoreductase [Pontibacter populi]